MAGRKEMIWQNDFSLGAVRPEAEERDDTDLITASLFEAENTVTLSTGQAERRPGLLYLDDSLSAQVFSVSLGKGRNYQLHILRYGYALFDENEALVTSSDSVDWKLLDANPFGSYAFTDMQFWAVSIPDQSAIIIGSKYFAMRALRVNDAGVWEFGEVDYPETQYGSPKIPFYRPEGAEKMSIIPTTSGRAAFESNFDFFTAAHIGTWIRHNGTLVLIDTVTDIRHASGKSYGKISRTVTLTVSDASAFEEGDAVEHSVTGGPGLITQITGSDIRVFCNDSYKDFPNSGKLIGPNASESITASSLSTYGSYVALWDAQMFSKVYGYANYGSIHKGRLYLCDYAAGPRAFAASQAGDLLNFEDGANDADAFIETISADRGGDLKFIVSAEDLLFMTTRGLYYQPSRDGNAITPLSIGPVLFSQVGCDSVAPMPIDDGAVFIDVVGRQVYAAILSGDAYRSWRALQISPFHSHLINEPIHIGATVVGAEKPEQFVYVTNLNGTVAVFQWDRDQNRISCRPWSTDGDFVAIYQAGKKVYALVDRRDYAGLNYRKRERFEGALYVDYASMILVDDLRPTGGAGVYPVPASENPAVHLAGYTAQVYLQGWDYGDLLIDADGKAIIEGAPAIYPSDTVRFLQIGLGYSVRCTPWARRSIRTQSGTREVKRIIDLYVTVRNTGSFKIGGAEYGGYEVGTDLVSPPPLVSREYRVGLAGGSAFKRTPIVQDRPGPFQLLKIGYKVSV